MHAFDRRGFLKLAGAAGIAGLPGALPLARAADAAAMEKAKAQGQAVFYANITAVQPIMDAFAAKTGIKGQYTRISSSKFIPTILTEFNAGKLLADVVQAPLPMLQVLKEQGVLAPYKSPAADGYPDWATKDDSITLFGIEYVSYLFNTDHLKKADAPATYEDLADPKWKGKIVMANPSNHASTIGWLVGLKEQVFKSEDDWMKFVKGLAANQPMFVASFGPTPAPVESGEKLIAISMPKYIVTKAPAPLDWGPRSGQPLLGSARAIAVTAKAPHPDAAHAFMDYWLSKEAMGLLAKDVGEYVLAPGVHPPIEGMDKAEVKPVRDLSDEELQKWGREFGKIFAVR
ncbi:extracellular solute-binding protein [Allopusillimonas soli]|uniref:Extracellular solute-binding protein n=1 Tax=Allopusillimonas soli TaxID=659016 RepID=A0A853FDH7_9BURK|nr:extracellular solute-binding protein [Allopusillimonas soli]NYT38123.1 extracellular solute-binding protein [Allopusillimonas soli]TEA74000.1 extracellular solute-binding protein [Allopusillimonas soli]